MRADTDVFPTEGSTVIEIRCRRFVLTVVLGLMCMLGCGQFRQAGEFSDESGQQTEESSVVQWEKVKTCELYKGEEEVENMAGLLQEQAGGMMVRIVTEELSGSGVIYRLDERQLWILTAAHLLEGWNGRAAIFFYDGLAVECTQAYWSGEDDIAFLQIPYEGMTQTGEDIPEEINRHLSNYKRALVDKEAFDNVQEGDTVIAMGSVKGVGENAYEGTLTESWVYVEDFSQYMMTAQVYVPSGMSGGGLFDGQGHLLGILCAGSCEDGVDEAAVIPLSMVFTSEETVLPKEFKELTE